MIDDGIKSYELAIAMLRWRLVIVRLLKARAAQ
jgi:hypothetical protein